MLSSKSSSCLCVAMLLLLTIFNFVQIDVSNAAVVDAGAFSPDAIIARARRCGELARAPCKGTKAECAKLAKSSKDYIESGNNQPVAC